LDFYFSAKARITLKTLMIFFILFLFGGLISLVDEKEFFAKSSPDRSSFYLVFKRE